MCCCCCIPVLILFVVGTYFYLESVSDTSDAQELINAMLMMANGGFGQFAISLLTLICAVGYLLYNYWYRNHDGNVRNEANDAVVEGQPEGQIEGETAYH